MNTQFNIYGKLPTKRNRFNFGFNLGKQGDPEKLLQECGRGLKGAEQMMSFYIKKGCTDCRLEETTELVEDNTISVSLSEIF